MTQRRFPPARPACPAGGASLDSRQLRDSRLCRRRRTDELWNRHYGGLSSGRRLCRLSDPVGSGFVPNLAHPGGNVTGFHNFEPAIGGKWLDLLRQIAPSLRQVAVLHVPDIVPNVAFLRVAEAAAPAFGITVTAAEARNAADIERVLPAFAQAGGGGLIVTPSALTATQRDLIIALAERLGLPAIYSFRFYAASGGLMSYGIDQVELVRAAASYVDRILRGTNPGELPVQLPTKFELVINVKTAGALGLTVPNSLQLLADEVIE